VAHIENQGMAQRFGTQVESIIVGQRFVKLLFQRERFLEIITDFGTFIFH
jgi:hypothetical protein